MHSKLVFVGTLEYLADAARRGAHAEHERLILVALPILGPALAGLVVVLADSRAELRKHAEARGLYGRAQALVRCAVRGRCGYD